jgi:hypothetical protein
MMAKSMGMLSDISETGCVGEQRLENIKVPT